MVLAVALAASAAGDDSDTVKWLPWSAETFQRARSEDKPVFLSIVHFGCHECALMDEQSFSERVVSRRVNAVFIPVRVDRDERPDLDALYRSAARVLTGDVNWPLHLVLMPDGQPFFATSYMPPDKVVAVADRIEAMWKDQRDVVRTSAANVTSALRRTPVPADLDSAALAAAAAEHLASRFDPVQGGFLPAPKYPVPNHLLFLLRYWHRTGDARALAMVETTLSALRRSALRDPIGHGYHRYASGSDWTRPHYEKTLYDQALLGLAFTETFQATRKQVYAQAAREVFGYALRDLRAPGGAFHAAQDADQSYYTGGDRTQLRPPRRDDRVATDWNGLMIAALAFASAVLDEPAFAEAAAEAATAVMNRRRPLLDDHAFLLWGLLNLYEATLERRWLDAAVTVEREARARFRDATGRFYVTAAEDVERLLVRPAIVFDQHVPAGAAVQLVNLTRLAHMTGDVVYESCARALARSAAASVRATPAASTHFLAALMFLDGPAQEIVLAGDGHDELKRATFGRYMPFKVVVHRPPGEAPLASIAPYTNELVPVNGTATAYVCTDFKCRIVDDPGKLWSAPAKPAL